MKILAPDVSAELHDVQDLDKTILVQDVLSEVRIAGADISLNHVKVLDIRESLIMQSHFSRTVINQFELRDCRMESCDFTASKLQESSWHAVEVSKSRCSGIMLQSSLLRSVRFVGCKLDMANFRFARLQDVVFEDCVMTEADFYNATLKNVAFINSPIEQVEFSKAQLTNVNLTRTTIESLRGITSMKGAKITSDQLYSLAPMLAQNIGFKIEE